jgi:hypothetical protein
MSASIQNYFRWKYYYDIYTNILKRTFFLKTLNIQEIFNKRRVFHIHFICVVKILNFIEQDKIFYQIYKRKKILQLQ